MSSISFNKNEFNGNYNEAVDREKKPKDLDKDGKFGFSDALSDGVLNKNEYQALKENYNPAEILNFKKDLSSFLQGSAVPEGKFVDELDLLEKGDAEEIHFYDLNKDQGFDRSETITTKVSLQISDKNGLENPGKNDLSILVNGKLSLETDLGKDFSLPLGVEVRTNDQNKVSLNLLGFQLLSIETVKVGENTNLIIKPPSQNLINSAKLFGLEFPAFAESEISSLLGISPDLITRDGENFNVSLLTLLQKKFPEGIELSGNKIKPEKLALENLQINKVNIQDNTAKISFTIKDGVLQGSSGNNEIDGGKKQDFTLDLAMTKLEIGAKKNLLENVSSGKISLDNLSTEINKIIQEETKDYLTDIQTDWQSEKLVVTAKGKDYPVKVEIPVTISEQKLFIDLSKSTILGLPSLKLAERLNQYLANTSELNSQVNEGVISFDLNELLSKKGPDEFKKLTIEQADFSEGKINLTFSKRSKGFEIFSQPEKQPAIFNNNIVSPFLGIDTNGNSHFGFTYTKSLPLGQSELGKLLNLDPQFGTVPNLSHSFLENTYNFSFSGSSEGSTRLEANTGIRAGASPFGLPFYLEFDPLGFGLKFGKDGTNAYLPTKFQAGYDDGKFSLGAFYQHNLIIGAENENIFGVSGGIRF